MKIFIDSADINEIKSLNDTGLIDGVTTNPSLIAKSGLNFIDAIEQICKIVDGPVSAEVTATDADTMILEGKKLSKIASNVVIKVPLTVDGLKACKKFSNQIALGLDAKDGHLAISGWTEESDKLTTEYLKKVNNYGVSRIIYTDINRDGTKQSPNFEETQKVADISNCPVVISGGVSSIDDIKKAKNLNNIEGVIVGKAIYDGDIKLDELAKEIDA